MATNKVNCANMFLGPPAIVWRRIGAFGKLLRDTFVESPPDSVPLAAHQQTIESRFFEATGVNPLRAYRGLPTIVLSRVRKPVNT